MKRHCLAAALLFAWASSSLQAGETAHGWRGNGTGLWPEAKAPLTWSRIAKGALEGMRVRADRPAGAEAGDAPLLQKGLIRDWLILEPFSVAEAVKQFDDDPLNGVTTVQPSAGDKVGDKAWQTATVPADDPTVFGSAELPWLDLVKPLGFQPNQFAYAHTYLFSPRGGPARIVVEHGEGMKAWLSGQVVYRSPERRSGLGYYTYVGKIELSHRHQPAGRFDLDLKPGWNRLLLKLSTARPNGHTDMRCSLRIMDPPNVPYETKNIVWMAELPGRSTSTPIQVGDKLFVMAEPDELVCIDKRFGKTLWRASNNLYEALPAAERQAKPAYAQQVDPLVAKLKQEPDPIESQKLRGKIAEALKQIDAEKFTLPADDHFEGHFGIVGFTMPTPVSDGKHVYVWSNMGVAACYDLEGKRRWIHRVPATTIGYGASPALADGVLAVFMGSPYGLDAKTGEILWKQQRIRNCVAAIQATKLRGQSVFVTQRAEILRPKDGEILYRPRDSTATGDIGWAPPVIFGELIFAPKYGVAVVQVFDFSAADPDKLEPKLTQISVPKDKQAMGDRWTAGSPLVWNDLIYQTDIYGWLYVTDAKTQQPVYRRQLDIRGLMHYNAVPLAASPTLVGKHILVCDNQGTTIVFEPGQEFKQVAVNQIETILDRHWPIPSQETLTYSPPLADGKRLYLRGERYLYCIGSE